jgi:ribosomal protein S18 acetylase RimI-like enzyme
MSPGQGNLLNYGDSLDDITETPGFCGYVAFMDKTLVGFLLGYRLRWFSESECVVSQIAVLQEHKELVIGRQLIDFLRTDQKAKGQVISLSLFPRIHRL